MKVSFVTITPDAEKLISYCARVSNPDNQENYDTAPKLIKYMIDHEHWSPFEMAHMVLEIETSRAISAQILRHRSFSFQEFSQRYSESTEFEKIELRSKSNSNRQSSEERIWEDLWFHGYDHGSDRCGLYWDENYFLEICDDYYKFLIKKNVSRETARMILPLCTKTRLYMSGSIRSWIHYIKLRTKPDTQKEHRLIAEECKKIFSEKMPIIYDNSFRT